MTYIPGLSGSLRAQSSNSALLREAARAYGPIAYHEADLRLPLYDGDHETTQGIPPVVIALAAEIAGASAVLISTPEYNKGPSGVLKNALDWISRVKPQPLAGKPVAVMSAAAGRAGGERAQMILRSFLVPFQPRLVIGPELHLANCTEEFDSAQRLTNPLYRDTLATLMTRLRDEAQR